MIRKVLLMLWLMLLMPVATLTAQDVLSGENNAAGEDDGASIVSHINSDGSRLSVTAPAKLLERAQKAETTVEDFDGGDEQAADEQEVSDQHARQKGGKSVGYRVQVFADNNVRSAKTEARQRERAIKQSFPDYGTYVAYVSPYWRLRVGDFRSQYDAEKAAAEIRRVFPRYAREVRVVRDRVNVR